MSELTTDEEFMLDLVAAVNQVADEHDASDVDKISAVAALGQKAEKGQWYTLNEEQ